MEFNLPFLNKFNAFLTTIIYHGTLENESIAMNRTVSLLNKFALVSAIALFATMTLDYIHGFYYIIFTKTFYLFSIPFAIYFNTKKYNYVGKIILMLSVSTLVFAMDNYFGKESGIYNFYYCIVIVIPFVFTSSQRTSFYFSIIFMAIIIFISVYFDHSLFLNKEISLIQKAELNTNNMIIVSFIILTYAIIIVKNNYKTENQLIENLNNAQNLSEQKDNILKIVAHDLRTPINWIKSSSQILSHINKSSIDIPSIKKEIDFSLGLINEGVTHANEIINDLLSLENEINEPLNLEKIDFEDFINKSLSKHMEKMKNKNINAILHLEQKLINVDEIKFARVIDNLLSNAIKFSNSNSRIWISCKKTSFTEIIIKDEGIGIPKEIEKDIFNEFTSAKRQGTSGEKSFGLGLSIAKKIVHLHKGSICFESKENQGTKFIIEIPN